MELTALDEVYGKDRSNLCYVGSVKANIGHLDAAGGTIDFIKAILSIKQGKIFPQPNLSQVMNHIKQRESFLRFATQTNSWNDNYRYAAVTSLDVGGINVHIIVSNHENNFTYISLPITNFRKFRYPINWIRTLQIKMFLCNLLLIKVIFVVILSKNLIGMKSNIRCKYHFHK